MNDASHRLQQALNRARARAEDLRVEVWLWRLVSLALLLTLAIVLQGCTVKVYPQRLTIRGNAAVVTSHVWVRHEVHRMHAGAVTFADRIEVTQERGW